MGAKSYKKELIRQFLLNFGYLHANNPVILQTKHKKFPHAPRTRSAKPICAVKPSFTETDTVFTTVTLDDAERRDSHALFAFIGISMERNVASAGILGNSTIWEKM